MVREMCNVETTLLIINVYFVVITELQPSSACEGINNIIKSSPPSGACRTKKSNSMYCDILTCSTNHWNLVMVFYACDKIGVITVMDRIDEDRVLVNETFPSDSQVQELKYSVHNQIGKITLNSRVVTNGQNTYYLLSLEAPILNISFPMTGIPIQCDVKSTLLHIGLLTHENQEGGG